MRWTVMGTRPGGGGDGGEVGVRRNGSGRERRMGWM